MRIRELQPKSMAREDLLGAVARARGCSTPAEIATFLDPSPPIPNAMARIPGYGRALDRIRRALDSRESIVLFGDFDCDGITSIVQGMDFLKAAGAGRVSWFTPDRMLHDYGLSGPALAECLRRNDASLLISLDCGSTSPGEIAWLRERGVDCIVVDHHTVPPGAALAAEAHLNPKAHQGPAAEEMKEMSASGLCFLFFEQLASDLAIGTWNRDRACLLAGIGTVVDVMPLIGVNRALVKRAIAVANRPDGLRLVPGLEVLKQVTRSGRIDARTFGFRWGPRLNASGRLEEATRPIECLLAESPEAALPLARACHEANQERRDIQQGIEQKAIEMASDCMKAERSPRVLLLCDSGWHPGIVGIVASRLRERFSRPVIVCGWHGEGYWKGSGRSPEGFDLGAAVQAARTEGLLLGGGGHRMAAGVKIAPEMVEPLREFLDVHGPRDGDELGSVVELLAPADALRARDAKALAMAWWDLFNVLEPFGAGNPQPCLLLRGSELRWGPKEKLRNNGGEAWALTAGFSYKGPGYLFADWTDVERAREAWEPSTRYDLILSLSRSDGSDRITNEPVTYYDWRVVDCERVG
jgi:single-stranded-DNA-specific exonuclease